MSVVSLNTNLCSLRTQRRLSESTAALSKSFERLSSGLRISRAADDAAGLAIANGLNVDARVFGQGLRNLSDGVSATNIAQGALNELTNIVLRLQELAEQAANGTLGHTQRSALDAEAEALSKEYHRIAKTTEFNGRKLLDGTVQGLSLQAGYGTDGALAFALGGKIGSGSMSSAANMAIGMKTRNVALGDLNGDGMLDIVSANYHYSSQTVSVLLGNGDGTFKAKTNVVTPRGPIDVALGDVNGDGVLDIVSLNNYSSSTSILLGNGDGTFKAKTDLASGSGHDLVLGDLNGDGELDIVVADPGSDIASVLLGNGNGTFKARVGVGTGQWPSSISIGDVNGDGFQDLVSANSTTHNSSVLLGNGDGSFRAKADVSTGFFPSVVALGDLNGDGRLDIVCGRATGSAVLLGNGNGTFKAKTDLASGLGHYGMTLGDLNGDGALDIVATSYSSNAASMLLGNGDGTFKAKVDFGTGTNPWGVALGDFNTDGVLDIVAANTGSNFVSVLIADTRDGVSPLLDFSLKTKADAKWALELMKQKLTQLSQQRGIIGANQSRLSTAVANLQVERENYDAARSQITDADIAAESATLVRTQILQQAASAVLSQANQAPALALRLLGG